MMRPGWTIALVVDTSGKMATRLPVVKRTLGDFVRNLNPCDELALFAFNSQVYVVQPFSTNHQMAAESLNLLKAYGKSALYEQLALLCRAWRERTIPTASSF